MNSSPEVKTKRNTKACRQCNKQVPTACKTCPCGFCFRKSSPTDSPETSEGGPAVSQTATSESSDVTHRRTQRTRRERPHFFDSLEYGTHFRKRRNLSAPGLLDHSGGIKRKAEWKSSTKTSTAHNIKSRNVSSSSSAHLITSPSSKSRATLCRISSSGNTENNSNNHGGNQGSNASSQSGNGEDDVYSELSADKMLQYSVVLAEINRKYAGVSCQPG